MPDHVVIEENTVAIEILNESDYTVDTDRLLELGRHLYASLHLHPQAELSVVCLNADAMEQLHLDWMDLPGPTDVMSFPMDELRPGTETSLSEGMLGDIVLCPEVAEEQAQRGGHKAEDELALLMVHGMLHLLGLDHDTEEGRAAMFELQDSLLSQFLGYPAPAPTID